MVTWPDWATAVDVMARPPSKAADKVDFGESFSHSALSLFRISSRLRLRANVQSVYN